MRAIAGAWRAHGAPARSRSPRASTRRACPRARASTLLATRRALWRGLELWTGPERGAAAQALGRAPPSRRTSGYQRQVAALVGRVRQRAVADLLQQRVGVARLHQAHKVGVAGVHRRDQRAERECEDRRERHACCVRVECGAAALAHKRKNAPTALSDSRSPPETLALAKCVLQDWSPRAELLCATSAPPYQPCSPSGPPKRAPQRSCRLGRCSGRRCSGRSLVRPAIQRLRQLQALHTGQSRRLGRRARAALPVLHGCSRPPGLQTRTLTAMEGAGTRALHPSAQAHHSSSQLRTPCRCERTSERTSHAAARACSACNCVPRGGCD